MAAADTIYRAHSRLRKRFMREWGVAMVYSPELGDTVLLNMTCYTALRLFDGTRTTSQVGDILFELLKDGRSRQEFDEEFYSAVSKMSEKYTIEEVVPNAVAECSVDG